MADTSWVILAWGHDRDQVKLAAELELLRLGLVPERISPNALQLDVGTEVGPRDFFRMKISADLVPPDYRGNREPID